jgi:hypothetical protein
MFASLPSRSLKLLCCVAAVYSLVQHGALRASDIDDVTARIAAAQKITVPVPEKTLFDSDPKARKIYLEEYCAGYRTVLASVVTDCHMGVKGPYLEAFQQGWEDGKNSALKAHPEKAAELIGIPSVQYNTVVKEPETTTPRPSSK